MEELGYSQILVGDESGGAVSWLPQDNSPCMILPVFSSDSRLSFLEGTLGGFIGKDISIV